MHIFSRFGVNTRQLPGSTSQPPQESPTPSGNQTNTVAIIASVAVVGGLVAILILYFVLRTLRVKNYHPRLLPGVYLKRKWNSWTPGSSYRQVRDALVADRGGNIAYRGAASSFLGMNSNGVQRDTSIRSIITLPAYSATPKATEQIIAREGERGGMDVVVEFPETNEEEEGRREDEMEALYQIRLRRREEIAEREERRRLRREARERGDFARLEELRHESRARAEGRTGTTAAAMLIEHQSRGRDRRVSSVSYADLGHVRHDGSRIRASSTDSEQRPLLDSTARNSLSSLPLTTHSRIPSASSILSTSTLASDLDTLQPTTSNTHSLPEQDDGDVGESRIPPPDYEHLEWGEAPAYESPAAERVNGLQQLPVLRRLPTIRVDIPTPEPGTPVTPAR